MAKVKLSKSDEETVLVRGALSYIPEIEGKIAYAKKKIKEFEKKYGKSFEELEKKGVGLDFKSHEDWFDWSHYNETVKEYSKKLKKLRELVKSGSPYGY